MHSEPQTNLASLHQGSCLEPFGLELVDRKSGDLIWSCCPRNPQEKEGEEKRRLFLQQTHLVELFKVYTSFYRFVVRKSTNTARQFYS